VDIGNGIMIDTDEVIYMENGPDFHTYTFSVVRDNASANAPVENILMSPNTDGSYRVFHIVLNLTEADKAKIANREYVDYKNKQQVTELANINLSSLSQKQICVPHYYSYPMWCKAHQHLPDDASCEYFNKPGAAYWASAVAYDCFGEQHETIMPTPSPIDGGGGGGGGGEGQEPPDDCTSLATDPTQVGLVSPSGCNIGVPTEPNIRPTQTPCVTIKKSTTDAKYKAHVETLKTQGGLTYEVGYKLSYPVPNSGQSGTQDQIIQNLPGTRQLDFTPTNYNFAFLHSHHDKLYPIFSPDDLVALNIWIKGVIDYNNNPNNLPKINLRELTISVVTLQGTYLISFDGTSIDPYPNYTQTQWNKLNNDYLQMMREAGSSFDSDYMEKIERQFLKFTQKYMPMPEMKLFKVESDGNTEIYLDNGNRRTKKCPQ
ncbi:hypothetical protein, partial [Chryseobacterium sp. Hurlbut01]|uniref:hypothetical protein n=1 Tax=Chryseobacterium sp. Hurlbut01 TaxID=1681828 RepID=UPI0018869931